MQNSSSACLFLQGKPPQDQKVGHPEVLTVIPIQQFSQPPEYIIFYSSMIIQHSNSSHITLFSFIPNMHCTLAQWPSFEVALFVFQVRQEEGQLLCGAILPPGSQGEVPQPHCTTFPSKTLQHLHMIWPLDSLFLVSPSCLLPFNTHYWQCFCFGGPSFYY